jgi:hypothetical protein
MDFPESPENDLEEEEVALEDDRRASTIGWLQSTVSFCGTALSSSLKYLHLFLGRELLDMSDR